MGKSKQRSGPKRSSSSRSQPETLFCDRSLGRRKVPDRLRQIHPSVVAHDDRFDQDTDDVVWLEEVGRKGWIVLMKDHMIRYRTAERKVILARGIRCFCLHPSKGMTGEDMGEAFARALPRILRISARESGLHQRSEQAG